MRSEFNLLKKTIIILMGIFLCVSFTGCLNKHKDLTNEEKKEYISLIESICDDYGYDCYQSTIIPTDSTMELMITNKNDESEISVTIHEDEFGNEDCTIRVTRRINSLEERLIGFDEHIDIIVKIAKEFSNDVTNADILEFIYNEDIWEEIDPSNYYLMYKTNDYMIYSIDTYDTYAKDYKEGDRLEEYLCISL